MRYAIATVVLLGILLLFPSTAVLERDGRCPKFHGLKSATGTDVFKPSVPHLFLFFFETQPQPFPLEVMVRKKYTKEEVYREPGTISSFKARLGFEHLSFVFHTSGTYEILVSNMCRGKSRTLEVVVAEPI